MFSRSKADEKLFEAFCAARRDLIQAGFESWLDELQNGFVPAEVRIEPKAKMAMPDTADMIRRLKFPDQIEDAVLKMVSGQLLKPLAASVRKSKAGDMVFLLKDPVAKVKVHIHMFSVTPRIEIEHKDGHGALTALENIMVGAGVVKQADVPRPWVLPCAIEDEDRTGRILDDYCSRSQ